MRIYFMGICGTAMGNAALLARAAGHEVLGADSGVYPPMKDVLADAKVTLYEGYDPVRLASLRPDLVVIGNAMSRGNPEVEWLLESRGLRFTSLPAFLSEFILSGRRNLVVCGTHGKTTTTALAAYLLRENARDPGFLIGGVPLDPPVGHHLGSLEDPFVIEGDEYDSAFFDKRSKFIHYQPYVAVLNNLEFDHADIFHDLRDVQRTFSHLTRIVPRNGWIVSNGDAKTIDELGTFSWTRQIRVGVGPSNDVVIDGFHENAEGASFRLLAQGRLWGEISWKLPGLFNARNAAMAATAAALCLSPGKDLDPSSINLRPLQHFRGVRRRQEIHIDRPDLTVVEDFGHHPTAIAETLASLRARHPGKALRAVFEPRSNTARTRVLQDDFAQALALADEVFLGAVNRAEKLRDDQRFDSAKVVEAVLAAGKQAYAGTSNADVLAGVSRATRPEKPSLVIFFSNGSFDGIIESFVASQRVALR